MKNKTLTIPNILTIFRLFLVPVFVLIYFYVDKTLALGVFLLASATDVLDGYLARKFNWISDIGKVLDPLADKSLRVTLVSVFFVDGVLPLWVLLIMVIFDLGLVLTSAVLFKKKYVVSSNIFGKVAEIFVVVSFVLCFFANSVSPWHLYAVYLSLILILISIVIYGLEVLKNYGKHREK
ncbi:MAG: CDP-alcohol phosphatidyltransferase family protein [Spirochaetales bacterium]